ncbi:MAG: (d)CMP kinase [Kiritimatiellaeota bacterium]|nr:(d)CMP kinase [Kiritimatiellota bacterium]
MEDTGFQIAIDGPAASGKSSVARRLAEALDAAYLNTGDMYRIVGRLALDRRIDPERAPEAVVRLLDGATLDFRRGADGTVEILVDGFPVSREAIRAPGVARAASLAARIPEVRSRLVALQRRAANLGRLVAEGRDIGTVVFPKARYKFFLTATPEVRARRRLAQDGEVPPDATVERVAAEIAERDRLDRTRSISPLREAPDAVRLDTSNLTVDQVVETILGIIRSGRTNA